MGTMHAVKDGDTLISIAHEHRFGDWKTIWNHERNAPLREKRHDPQVLAKGDEVWVPDKRQGEKVVATNRKHAFTLRTVKAVFRVVLQDGDGTPFAGKKWKLKVGEKTFEGTSGPDGAVVQEVPPDANEGELEVAFHEGEDPVKWTVEIGALQPASDLRGAQARLQNLGYRCSPTGTLDDDTRDAVREFQKDMGGDPTGELDEATREALRLIHDHGEDEDEG